MGNKRLQVVKRVTGGHKGLQWVTKQLQGLKGVTNR